MNSVSAAEASLDRIIFHFFSFPYSALRRAAETSSSYACICAIPTPFPGSVLGPIHFPLKVGSWDENQASWTLDSGISRSELRQMVFFKVFVPLDLAQLKLLRGPLCNLWILFPAILYNGVEDLSHGPISLLVSTVSERERDLSGRFCPLCLFLSLSTNCCSFLHALLR